MGFNPKAAAAIAIKNKQKLGILPKNPMSPQNLFKSLPNLVPPSTLSPLANPMALATTNLAAPKIPGLPKFAGLKKKLRGF